MANLEMRVRGGAAEGGGADINRLAWRRAGRGPAHSADSVRSSLPILMSHGGSECESAARPPGGRTQSARRWKTGRGSAGQQDEIAEVRHSAYQDGRWSNNVG